MSFTEVESHKCHGGWQRVLRHSSQALSCAMNVGVFLPPQTESGPCPVLYFLSGLSCTEQNFITKAGAQQWAAAYGVVLVAPDTSPRGEGVPDDAAMDLGGGAGFYVNATAAPWDRHYRMEDYVVSELPALIEATLPARPDRRGLCGHSMGGHGALVLALRHPERYRSVSALAPIAAAAQSPWGQKALLAYLGPDPARWAEHDAAALLKAGRRFPGLLLIDQGQADPFLQEQLKPHLLELAARAVGQPLTLRQHEGYDHSYYFVSSFIGDHVRHHAQALYGP